MKGLDAKIGALTPTDKLLSHGWNDKMAFQTTSNISWHFMINIQPQPLRSWAFVLSTKNCLTYKKLLLRSL